MYIAVFHFHATYPSVPSDFHTIQALPIEHSPEVDVKCDNFGFTRQPSSILPSFPARLNPVLKYKCGIMSLANKVFLITGASKGIGRATAERVAAEGASVVINYLSDSTAADELVAKIGADRALAVQADASNLADIDRLVAAAVEKFGKIDVVMPNGASSPLPIPSHMTEVLFSCSLY